MLNINGYWDKYEPAISDYCAKHDLSYVKLCSSPCCYDKEELIMLHRNPGKGALGMLDETPMPVTLKIFLKNGKLRFEQTDITRKYLGADVGTAAKPVRPSVRDRRGLAYA